MNEQRSATTRRLLLLCLVYLVMYVLNGTFAKYFTAVQMPHVSEMDYNFHNTLGSVFIALLIPLLWNWYRMPWSDRRSFGPFKLPVETPYIILSGFCTAIIVPGTTLMYTVTGLSIMVAMAIMRGCIIIVSRLVDAIQIRQGLMKKKIYPEENWSVVFALLGLLTWIVWGLLAKKFPWIDPPDPKAAGHPAVAAKSLLDTFHIIVLVLYVAAYAVRLYIMNYYKNTRDEDHPQDNKGYFAIEQTTATLTMVMVVAGVLWATVAFRWTAGMLVDLNAAVHHPLFVNFGALLFHPNAAGFKAYLAAQPHTMMVLSGIPYGVIAFVSVFIFMYQGRSATFAGVLNRVTSLIAGVGATLTVHFWFNLPKPKRPDWIAIGFVLVAVYFLAVAEKKRKAEEKKSKE